MVNPLEYDFSLRKKAFYPVLGVIVRLGTPWVYIVRPEEDFNIDIFPAVLFEFNWNKIPIDWVIRIDGPSQENIELLPEKLTLIENWFEKYIDEDPKVLSLLASHLQASLILDEE
jgi:hypothetical protein